MPTYTRPEVTIDDATATEIRAVVSEIEQLQPVVAALGERLYRVIEDFTSQSTGRGLLDDEYGWLMDQTGVQGAYNAAMDLVAHLTCATSCVPGEGSEPSWYRRIKEA